MNQSFYKNLSTMPKVAIICVAKLSNSNPIFSSYKLALIMRPSCSKPWIKTQSYRMTYNYKVKHPEFLTDKVMSTYVNKHIYILLYMFVYIHKRIKVYIYSLSIYVFNIYICIYRLIYRYLVDAYKCKDTYTYLLYLKKNII